MTSLSITRKRASVRIRWADAWILGWLDASARVLLGFTLVACGASDSRSPAAKDSAVAGANASEADASAPVVDAPRVDLAAVDTLVQPLIEGGWVPALSVVIVQGEDVHHLSYGVVRPQGEPVDAETLFEIGSLTTVFTATLLQSMVEGGEVRLSDPVASLLPSQTQLPADGGDAISLLDLATHHSGLPTLPDDFVPADEDNPYADYTPQRMHEFLSGASLMRPPGMAYEYSNLGFALLGDALAQHRAAAYEALMHARVFAPLAMQSTWLDVPQEQRARLAQGQNADGEARPAWDLAAFAPAGGIRSSARDLSLFLSAALATKDNENTRLVTGPMQVQREIPGGHIGLGWHIASDGLIWNNGGTGGCHSFMALDRERRVGVALLAASAGAVVDQLGTALVDVMRGHQPPPLDLPRAIEIDPAKLDDYVGTYPLDPALTIKIWRDGDALRGQGTGQAAFRLWPLDTDLFYLRVLPAQIDFQRDPDGAVVSLILHQSRGSAVAFRDAKVADR